jgi:membrane-bound lytic murein transglycosylase D
MWQFIRARGREYGLNQTGYHDDRLDPEKATRSAARHLRDLYKRFGDWYLAIAGYNCGDGCVERAVQRTGYADFWEMRKRNALPRETTNYVPIIVAMSIMHKNAKDYGLEDIEIDPPLEYETFTAEAPTHLGLIADSADRPVSEIRELNPALLSNVAPAGYDIHVPPGTRTQVLATLQTIPAARRASWRVHRVGEGDTIETIARRYRMPVSAITAANDALDTEVGDVLVIPTASQLERSAASRKTTAKAKRAPSSKASKGRATASQKASKRGSTPRAALRRGVNTAGVRR